MNLRKAENYNIGLDIGTGSVGWAVTDAEGNLYHFKKRPTWGSRLFPSADTAAAARGPRGQRRRYDRRRQRLNWLQEFFIEEMEKVDPDFFIRLNQSRLLPEDREEGHADYKWPLFNDSDFTERDYYQKFPTIYHLRKWLMETDEKADIRLIYLAFHNIVKTRGNFLHQDNPGLSAKNASMKGSLERLLYVLDEWCSEREIEFTVDVSELLKVLEDSSMSRSEKRDASSKLFTFSSNYKDMGKQLSNAVLGYETAFGKLFGIEAETTKFSLSKDEKIEEFLAQCPDDTVPLFEAVQTVYSAFILSGILKGADGSTISGCKIKEYETYGEQLRLLKILVREYAPESYDTFFRGAHYEAPYSKDYDVNKAAGYTRYNLVRKQPYDDFKKEVENLFKDTGALKDVRYQEMMQQFAEQTFLRRLKTSDNGSIPYQLHLEEMDAIIKKQGKYYGFLLDNKDKIESLVSFRIPYYVGPLTTKNARRKDDANPDSEMRFAWSVRKDGKEAEPIRPWNWEEIIDKDKSAEQFIRRMTGTCTYLQGEPVLPRCSLLYEKYCVLNELNGARWTQDGDDWHRFDYADRIDVVEDLFQKQASVSYKQMEDYLRQKGRLNPHVKGGQGENKFESKLSSWRFFCKLLGKEELTTVEQDMAEKIIHWNTLFEDRDILWRTVKTVYGDILSDEQIKAICNKRFTGWGRLSKKFLTEVKVHTSEGPRSIMDVLEEGDFYGEHKGYALVLMQILMHDKYRFKELIEEHNREWVKLQGGMTIQDLPGSPALRRSVNQAIKVVEEIVSIAKRPPTNIFIEVTREEDKGKKGKRTTRRYDRIKESLNALKEEGLTDTEILKQLEDNKNSLDDRLTLYFAQNGKCLYSGKPLLIERVIAGDGAYEVDHIIPRTYYKDDSFDNKALVLREENQRKVDTLLLESSIQSKMRDIWRSLRDAKLISDKKYSNLIRSHISDEQIKGFINRQLVETSQIVKLVQMMLSEQYPETTIQPIKAALSSQLRDACNFVKSREANSYHHAHDALLACELGRFIQFRHPKVFDEPIAMAKMMRRFINSKGAYYEKHRRLPDTAFFVDSFRLSGIDKNTGEIVKDTWDADAEISKIRRFLNYKDCFISRMPEVTSGVFWNDTIYSPKGQTKELSLPLKKGLNPSKYGSYSSEKFASFFMFAYEDKKGKTKLVFKGLPISMYRELTQNSVALHDYACQLMPTGSSNCRIIRERIYKYQIIEYGNDRFFLPGEGVVYPEKEAVFSQRALSIIADIEKAVEKGSEFEGSSEDIAFLFDEVVNKLEIVCSRYSNIAETLLSGKQAFLSASVGEQQSLLVGLLKMMSSSSTVNTVNLGIVDGPPNAGKLTNGFLTKDYANVTFIDQSVTGMFERRQKIEL